MSTKHDHDQSLDAAERTQRQQLDYLHQLCGLLLTISDQLAAQSNAQLAVLNRLANQSNAAPVPAVEPAPVKAWHQRLLDRISA